CGIDGDRGGQIGNLIHAKRGDVFGLDAKGLGGTLGVEGGELAGGEGIDAETVGRAIAGRAGNETDVAGGGIAAELPEPGEDGVVPVGEVPGVVPDARVFDVFHGCPGIEQAAMPGARGFDGNGRVRFSLEEADGQVAGVGGEIFAAGDDVGTDN